MLYRYNLSLVVSRTRFDYRRTDGPLPTASKSRSSLPSAPAILSVERTSSDVRTDCQGQAGVSVGITTARTPWRTYLHVRWDRICDHSRIRIRIDDPDRWNLHRRAFPDETQVLRRVEDNHEIWNV